MCIDRDTLPEGCSSSEEFINNNIVVDDIISLIEDDRSDTPSQCCPICQFTVLTDDDFVDYVSQFYSLTKERILNEIKNKFTTYNDFINEIKLLKGD